MKRILSLFLTLILLLSFTGCEKKSDYVSFRFWDKGAYSRDPYGYEIRFSEWGEVSEYVCESLNSTFLAPDYIEPSDRLVKKITCQPNKGVNWWFASKVDYDYVKIVAKDAEGVAGYAVVYISNVPDDKLFYTPTLIKCVKLPRIRRMLGLTEEDASELMDMIIKNHRDSVA